MTEKRLHVSVALVASGTQYVPLPSAVPWWEIPILLGVFVLLAVGFRAFISFLNHRQKPRDIRMCNWCNHRLLKDGESWVCEGCHRPADNCVCDQDELNDDAFAQRTVSQQIQLSSVEEPD